MDEIFTFWEGEMPSYIKLCIDTWKFPYIMLDNNKLKEYTNISVEPLSKFTLPQIADYVRVHVLRDNGGYWLDADTIMITDKLPTTNMIGNPITRSNTIGYLYAEEPNIELFTKWAKYQDIVANHQNSDSSQWSIMGNNFTNTYVLDHNEVTISSVRSCWPETYMVKDDIPRYNKYLKFYFDSNYHLSDIYTTDMIMLHNSWTPDWYKKLNTEEVLKTNCTMSNILREVLTCKEK